MRYKHSAVFILCSGILKWMSVMAAVDKYTIQMKDGELVGDDPAVMRELRRRMPDVSLAKPEGLIELDHGLDALALSHQISEIVRSGHPSGSTNQTNIQRRQEEERKYKAYIKQPNDGVVGTFALQMIEQAIHSVQYRLKEVDHYVRKYNKDVRFRMGYIFKQLEQWIYEMEVLYSYITYAERINLVQYNIHKNMIYYSQLVKRNFDITYTIYHLLKLHTDFVAQVQQLQQKGPGEEGHQKLDHGNVNGHMKDNKP